MMKITFNLASLQAPYEVLSRGKMKIAEMQVKIPVNDEPILLQLELADKNK